MLAVWMQWNRMIHHHDQFLYKNTNSHSFLPQYPRVLPIITPRFAISCSQQLMDALGLLAIEKDLPVQVCTDGYYIKQHFEFLSIMYVSMFWIPVLYKCIYFIFFLNLWVMKKTVESVEGVFLLIRRWGIFFRHTSLRPRTSARWWVNCSRSVRTTWTYTTRLG